MWYEDLIECDYFGTEYSQILKAVGWLERGKSFSIGAIAEDAYIKLCRFSKNPWSFVMFMGRHECDLC